MRRPLIRSLGFAATVLLLAHGVTARSTESKKPESEPFNRLTVNEVEKRLADELDTREVEKDALGCFQGLGDPVVDLLRVDTHPHLTAVIAHPNDLVRRVTHCHVPCVASPCVASFARRPAFASA